MRTFAAAWRLLTVIPWFTPAGDDEAERIARSPVMFPLVGLVLGLLAAGLACLFTRVLPPLPAAALLVAALALFSGGYHLDGLADCGDAFLSPGHDRDRALAVMKDSRIGAHGALALALVLLLKFTALASLAVGEAPAVVCVMAIAGRVALLFPMSLLPYARPSGVGGLFKMGNPVLLLCWGMVVTVAAAQTTAKSGLIVVAALVVPLAWTWYLRRRLGGATGDCYGAACELTETAVAVAAAVV